MSGDYSIFAMEPVNRDPALPEYVCKICAGIFASSGTPIRVSEKTQLSGIDFCPSCWESECSWVLAALLCLVHYIREESFKTVLLAVQYRQNTSMF